MIEQRYSLPDFWIFASVIGLVAIGLVGNYSTSFAEGELTYGHFYRQLLWGAIGFGGMVFMASLPTRFFQSTAYFLYALGIVTLLAVFVVGHEQMGAKRWIEMGPFQFQPSEFAKVTTILGIAQLLSDYPREIGKSWMTLAVVGAALLPMGLILVQPDLGTSLVYPMVMFCLLAWAGVPLWHLLLLLTPILAVITSWHTLLHLSVMTVLLVGVYLARKQLVTVVLAAVIFLGIGVATPHLWGKLHPYQQKRLLTFVNPEADPLGSAYQLIQSKIAIGSGQIAGKGFLHGTQTQLKFLPEGHTDFIYSAWSEEFGFMGSMAVVLLFAIFFYRGIRVAAKAHNTFNSLVTAGIVSLLVLQALTNLLMTVGFLPVTGVPLPFVSYGGSSLLSCMGQSGIVLGVSMRWRRY
jgi:rod shape determining protein RodA